MAYYMITFGAKLYTNAELYRAFHGITDAQFVRRIAAGQVNARSLLGNVVISISKSEATKMVERFASITMQDIDRAIAELEPAQGGEPLPAGFEVLALEETRKRFVKFNGLEIEKKYAKRDKMATIRVCGALYVALGHRKKGQDGMVLQSPTKGA